MIAFLRSVLHMVVMAVSIVPCALLIVLSAAVGVGAAARYKVAQFWLWLSIQAARLLLGIEYRTQGFENLPVGQTSPAILLVKHQSTYETFLMPAIMPHPLAYVFKRELLYVPFFGWAIGLLDMVHIDRSQRAKELFAERLDYFAPRLGVSWKRLSLSSASTRWGTVSADGAIRLNWRLIHHKLDVIDYVVAHELSHLKVMDHSPQFWDTVKSVMPDYPERRRVLRDEPLAPWG